MKNLDLIKQVGDLSRQAVLISCMGDIKRVVREKLELKELTEQTFAYLGLTGKDAEEAIEHYSLMPDVILTPEDKEEITKIVSEKFKGQADIADRNMSKMAPYLMNPMVGGQNVIEQNKRNIKTDR